MPAIIEVNLKGRITRDQLESALNDAEEIMNQRGGSHRLLLTVREPTILDPYEQEARAWFTKVWGPRNRDRVEKIAIVSESVILRMAATAVGLATRYRINAFSKAEDAEEWLLEEKVKKR